MTMKAKKKSSRLGSSLDDFLKSEGNFEKFQAVAIKEVIAWQLQKAMETNKMSRNKMAGLMHTSRAQINRLLDPETGNVTLDTLQRAAGVLGQVIHVELVPAGAPRSPARHV